MRRQGSRQIKIAAGSIERWHVGHFARRRQGHMAWPHRRRRVRGNGSRKRASVGFRSLRISRRSGGGRQNGGGRRGCLLDRAGVVILMSCQGRATCKCLLAIGVWAFVRSLAGMDATVSRQRARVAERLYLRQSEIIRYTRPCRRHIPCYIAHTCEVFRPYELGRARSTPISG